MGHLRTWAHQCAASSDSCRKVIEIVFRFDRHKNTLHIQIFSHSLVRLLQNNDHKIFSCSGDAKPAAIEDQHLQSRDDGGVKPLLRFHP